MTASQTTPFIDPGDSSATIMRGVAAALRGTWMQPQILAPHLVRLAETSNRLPPGLRQRALGLYARSVGVDPLWAPEITTAALAAWATGLYEPEDQPVRQCDAVVIGAASGGVGHLAALLNAPLLAQSFVTRYRYHGQTDDASAYQTFGARLAEAVLGHNADLAVINHYDPVHDRFLVPHVNHIRMKLLELPGRYATFIRQHLQPGGTVLFADCHYPWGQYRIGRRHYFQVGGLGGIPDSAYVDGSPEVARFLAEHGLRDQGAWALPFPWLPAVESEWGAQPPFRASVESFAAEHGYRFLAVNAGHPEDFSRLAFYASYQAALNAGREPAGVLVDCFTQTSPTAALQAGLLPLWLPFNCTDSLTFLRDMAPSFPRRKPVLLALMPSLSPSWDVATAQEWQKACGPDTQVTWIGTDPEAYPLDLAALVRFVPALQAWCALVPDARAASEIEPQRVRFTVEDLEALIASMAAESSTEVRPERRITEVPN
jgi:hypothetical protein